MVSYSFNLQGSARCSVSAAGKDPGQWHTWEGGETHNLRLKPFCRMDLTILEFVEEVSG